jgi:hypothetical protein
MENKKFPKNTIIVIFNKVTSEEKEVALQHEVKLFNVKCACTKQDYFETSGEACCG